MKDDDDRFGDHHEGVTYTTFSDFRSCDMKSWVYLGIEAGEQKEGDGAGYRREEDEHDT